MMTTTIKTTPEGIEYCEIPLTQGQVAMVSPCDFERLNQFKWYAFFDKSRKCYIVRRNDYSQSTKEMNWRSRTLLMHRVVLELEPGRVPMVDHVDGNTLNNTRTNLRECTHRQNMYNSRKRRRAFTGEVPSSKYKGVTWCKRDKIFIGNIRTPGKTVCVGYFKDEIECARAYDKAAREFHGEFARLNFPDERGT